MGHFLKVAMIMTMVGIVLTEKNLCRLPKEPGICKGYFPSWYYDHKEKECVQFTYGGCGGNDNRFQSERDCVHRCGKRDFCKLPSDTGRCRGYEPSWFYNSETKECEVFIYGRCGGNFNRFETKEKCEGICGKPKCKDGIAECKRNPCDGARCDEDPDAICVPDYCGGCNTRWFKRSGRVPECSTSQGKLDCQPEDMVLCYVNPCLFDKCELPNQEPEQLMCMPNYCGGCNTVWFKATARVPQCDTDHNMKN